MIFTFDVTTMIPYVLFIEKNVPDLSERNKLYDALEAYIARRVVTRETTKNYNRIFAERLIYNRILSREAFITYMQESDDASGWIPSDARMHEAFHESILVNSYATGILYLIESRIRNRNKHSTGLLGVDRYSLEHLMPKKWRNNWKVTDDNFDSARRDHTLLTLITQSLNASIRDSDWNTKKNGKGTRDGLLKYADGLDTLSDYLHLKTWDEDTIFQRAEWLYGKAADIWHMEGLKDQFPDPTQANQSVPASAQESPEGTVQETSLAAHPTAVDAPGSMQARRRRYWDYALKFMKEEMQPYTCFQNVTTSKEYWIYGFIGISGFSISCEFKTNKASVALILGKRNRDANKEAYDYLYARKKEIEEKLGVELDWWRFEQGKAAYVNISCSESVSIYSEGTWETAAKFHAKWARLFREFIVPYLLEWNAARQ